MRRRGGALPALVRCGARGAPGRLATMRSPRSNERRRPMARRAPANLLIQLDHGARGRLQQQIVTAVRRAIASGVMRPGTRVPSSRALAADLRVSRTTSQLALDQLRAEGYLVTRHGSGTFVAA